MPPSLPGHFISQLVASFSGRERKACEPRGVPVQQASAPLPSAAHRDATAVDRHGRSTITSSSFRTALMAECSARLAGSMRGSSLAEASANVRFSCGILDDTGATPKRSQFTQRWIAADGCSYTMASGYFAYEEDGSPKGAEGGFHPPRRSGPTGYDAHVAQTNGPQADRLKTGLKSQTNNLEK